jgi:long-subunit fatty acid transport protein
LRLSLLWLAALVTVMGRVAAAHPFFQENIGGTVFVGPTSPHASAVFWNPAAAGLLKGTHLYLGSVSRLDYTSEQRDPISGADGAPNPAGDVSYPAGKELGFSPAGFAGIVTDAGTDRFTFGLALYTPFAERIPGGNASGAYHTQGGFLYGTELSLAVTFRFSSTFYAGFAGTLLFSETKLSFLRDRALDGCAAAPCNLERPENADRFEVSTHADFPFFRFRTQAGYKLGILFRLAGWWFGASVSALSLLPTSSADVVRTGSVEVTPAGSNNTLQGESTVAYRLPNIVNFGARNRIFPDWDLLLQGRWITYSSTDFIDLGLFGTSLRGAGIPERIVRYRGYRDTVAVEAGLENPPERAPRLGARVRFESSALPSDNVTPGNIDGPNLTFAGGAELRLTTHWALVLGLATTLALPIDVHPSAFSPPGQIACAASGYDLDTCSPVSNGRGISSTAGSYTRLRGDITVGLSYDVW